MRSTPCCRATARGRGDYAALLARFPAALAAHLRRPRDFSGPHEPNEVVRALSRELHADIAAGRLPREAIIALTPARLRAGRCLRRLRAHPQHADPLLVQLVREAVRRAVRAGDAVRAGAGVRLRHGDRVDVQLLRHDGARAAGDRDRGAVRRRTATTCRSTRSRSGSGAMCGRCLPELERAAQRADDRHSTRRALSSRGRASLSEERLLRAPAPARAPARGVRRARLASRGPGREPDCRSGWESSERRHPFRCRCRPRRRRTSVSDRGAAGTADRSVAASPERRVRRRERRRRSGRRCRAARNFP
jgi:hypothetical protein